MDGELTIDKEVSPLAALLGEQGSAASRLPTLKGSPLFPFTFDGESAGLKAPHSKEEEAPPAEGKPLGLGFQGWLERIEKEWPSAAGPGAGELLRDYEAARRHYAAALSRAIGRWATRRRRGARRRTSTGCNSRRRATSTPKSCACAKSWQGSRPAPSWVSMSGRRRVMPCKM